MNDADSSTLTWYKSSYSSGNGQCTTCARRPTGGMAVKDSQNPDGPALLFAASQWQAFIHQVRQRHPK